MTLIKNATIKRSYQTAKSTDLIALGTESGHDSMSIDLGNLKLWMGSITDKISAGDSYVQVIDGGHGEIDVVVDSTTAFTINVIGGNSTIIPGANKTLDIGTYSNKIGNINIAGGINVGSDIGGDIYYRTGNGLLTRLQIGATDKVLKSNGLSPYWGDSSESLSNVDRISLDANLPLNITFANPFSMGSNYDVVLITNGYDNNGNSVAVTITNITTTGFTAEASTGCSLHYYASIKPSTNK